MFGISGLELLVILVVAIAVIPADKWPDAARAVAKAVRNIQHFIGKVQDNIESIKNEIEKDAPIDALTADVIENFRMPLAAAKRPRAKTRAKKRAVKK
jgi:Sec-independent protein translocase protein TatA